MHLGKRVADLLRDLVHTGFALRTEALLVASEALDPVSDVFPFAHASTVAIDSRAASPQFEISTDRVTEELCRESAVMKKWNGSSSPSTFIFWRVCFFIGMPALILISLGQLKFDDREGPGWNPFSKMPDGKIGISEDGAATFGCVLMMGVLSLITAIR